MTGIHGPEQRDTMAGIGSVTKESLCPMPRVTCDAKDAGGARCSNSR